VSIGRGQLALTVESVGQVASSLGGLSLCGSGSGKPIILNSGTYTQGCRSGSFSAGSGSSKSEF